MTSNEISNKPWDKNSWIHNYSEAEKGRGVICAYSSCKEAELHTVQAKINSSGETKRLNWFVIVRHGDSMDLLEWWALNCSYSSHRSFLWWEMNTFAFLHSPRTLFFLPSSSSFPCALSSSLCYFFGHTSQSSSPPHPHEFLTSTLKGEAVTQTITQSCKSGVLLSPGLRECSIHL